MPSLPYCRHLLIIEDEKGRRDFSLEKAFYSIGRDRLCDICLVSQFVSRCHARLLHVADERGDCRYRIVDGDLHGNPSANGLLINGRKRLSGDLRDQDVVVFGPGVKVTYLLLRREASLTGPLDEFDITLISPGMVGEPEPADHSLEAEIDASDPPSLSPPGHSLSSLLQNLQQTLRRKG